MRGVMRTLLLFTAVSDVVQCGFNLDLIEEKELDRAAVQCVSFMSSFRRCRYGLRRWWLLEAQRDERSNKIRLKQNVFVSMKCCIYSFSFCI